MDDFQDMIDRAVEQRANGTTPRYPNLQVQLTGKDGNIFHVLATVSGAMKRAGITQEEREKFVGEVKAAPNYDAALAVVMSWVDVL